MMVHQYRREHLKRRLNISMKQWNQQPILVIMPILGRSLLTMHSVKILLLEHSNGTKIIEKISSIKIRFFLGANHLLAIFDFYLILTSAHLVIDGPREREYDVHMYFKY